MDFLTLSEVVHFCATAYCSYGAVIALFNCTKYDVVENFNIPPMTTVCVFPFIQHRDEKIFTDPEEFIPERFLDEDIKSKLHVFGYIPFSAGARNCIGKSYARGLTSLIVYILNRM
jgi:cytochrome P450